MADIIGRPFGLAPDAAGNGTTPMGLQRVIGSKWLTAGVIAGCKLSGTTKMAYQVGAGAAVVFIDQAAMRAVEVPLDTITVDTTAAPATGSRVDSVYIDPATFTVKVGPSVPAGAALIGRAQVNAGITGTNSAIFLADNVAALPGASYAPANFAWPSYMQADPMHRRPEFLRHGNLRILTSGLFWLAQTYIADYIYSPAGGPDAADRPATPVSTPVVVRRGIGTPAGHGWLEVNATGMRWQVSNGSSVDPNGNTHMLIAGMSWRV